MRVTIGIIIAPSAIPPARAEKCFTGLTRSSHAKMPITIEGKPLSTSARKRTVVASIVARFSAKYSPAPTPTGKPTALAMAMRINVPTIAFAMPPPASPGGRCICVKNAKFTEDAPSRMRWMTIRSKGRIAIEAATYIKPTMMLLRTRRRRIVRSVRSATARWRPLGAPIDLNDVGAISAPVPFARRATSRAR